MEQTQSHGEVSKTVRDYLQNHGDLLRNLKHYKQEHVLENIDELNEDGIKKFCESLDEIDFNLMSMLYDDLVLHPENKTSAAEITPIQNKFRLKNFPEEDYEKLRHTGLDHILKGQVGVVLLSGGQGTRLGFDKAKGMYNVEMPSGKTLFEYFANRIHRICQIAYETFSLNESKPTITWYVMTSEMNNQEITEYFAEKNYFGLGAENVKFFNQQSLPAIDLNGKIIMEQKNEVQMSPNGNGGLFHSLHRHGILKDMRERGIKYVHIFGVDNILAKPADPFFIGFTSTFGYDIACKFVPKKHPEEKVGVHVLYDGKPHVVEYSEITKEMAYRQDDQGNLVFDASHIVNSVYNIDFLEHIATHGIKELIHNYHIAKKKINYYDNASKQTVTPKDINGYKFELFIFDVFRLAKPEKFGLVEVKREEEFAPVKNAPGTAEDSPDTARELISSLHQSWFEKNGVKFDKKAGKEKDSLFEVDPEKVYDERDLKLSVLIDRHKETEIKLPCYLKE